MKRNRDAIAQMAIYDLLCRMNETMKRKKMQDNHDIRTCIMDVLNDSGYPLCNGARLSDAKTCGECVARYLNKESE